MGKGLTIGGIHDILIRGEAKHPRAALAVFSLLGHAVTIAYRLIVHKVPWQRETARPWGWPLLASDDSLLRDFVFYPHKGEAEMLLDSIRDGMITVTLTPEDAQVIALACAHAHAPLLSEQPDDCRMVDAIGAAFDAASVAASLQNGVSVKALAGCVTH